MTLVDRNNHHLFQPFLFQVATSILEPAEIATPIRSLLNNMPHVKVEMREAIRVDITRRVVVMNEGDDLPYDMLVVATGAQTSYFGHESEWAQHAQGLKTLPDAIAARNRLLNAFERAEMESDPGKQARFIDNRCRRRRSNRGGYYRHHQRVREADLAGRLSQY